MTHHSTFYIASRYANSNRYNRFALIVQRLSILGIAVGVTILIVISSIFNGFRHEITQSLHLIKPHIVITHDGFWWHDWQHSAKILHELPTVQKVAPRIRTYGVVAARLNTPPVQLIGDYDQPWTSTRPFMPSHKTSTETVKEPSIIPVKISRDLQSSMQLELGDTFSIMTANPSSAHSSPAPVAIRVQVQDIINQPLATDQRSIHMPIHELTDQLDLSNDTINEITVTAEHVNQIPDLIRLGKARLPDSCQIHDISQQFNTLLASLAMQRLMMVIVLSLVVIVAACNLITSLVMIVMERKQEIALLQTIGATKRHIVSIFVLQGLMLTSASVAIGSFSGAVIGNYITDIVYFIERHLHIKIISDQVFMLDYLPSIVSLYDVIIIAMATFVLAILASLYPAYMACRVQPAEVLRYE